MQKTALSILSHVAHGYVGNRAVVFPLQYYGWNVDAIHTTDFLNHPGYGQFKGQKTDPEVVKSLLDGLRKIIDLRSEYQLILVGYSPSAQTLSAIYQELTPVLISEKATSKPILVVDPVLGDNGKLYVPQEIVAVHTEFLKLGLVDLITPNQFELELLTGIKIDTWANVQEALTALNDLYHISNIVLLSVVIDGEMFGVGYSQDAEPSMFCIPIRTIECRFSGCGDVFTALITHAFYENDSKLTPKVLGSVISKLSKILKSSFDDEKNKIGRDPVVVQDVRLVQLRKILDEQDDTDFEFRYI